jgi:thymidine phosphorylase
MMWIPQETIRDKRDGRLLKAEQIQAFVAGITDGSVSEGQIAAFAMATYFNGMDIDERRVLTLAMRDSGDVMRWDVPGPVLDKHSTGGVGDMVSLMLGPIVAACGAYIPMITGRGLGHTGGTLDKLESIPGYQAKPDNLLFQRCVKELGVCIIGQTSRLAPADQRFYATRDVTATVESVSLITASILSKKLAEGLDGLVMDVKVGNGAFMTDLGQATELAKSIVEVANSAGVKTSASLTDMSSPLGYTAGNAVEIRETLDYLSGSKQHPALHEVTMELAAAMLVNGGLAPDHDAGIQMAENALSSGKAAAIFAKMVHVLGGPSDLFENPDKHLPKATVIQPVLALRSGYVQGYETRAVGMSVVALGGGRLRAADAIDHRVGFSDLLPIGSVVEKGTPVAMLHANSQDDWHTVAAQLLENMTIGETAVAAPSRILTRI